jgi:hypothetical protein
MSDKWIEISEESFDGLLKDSKERAINLINSRMIECFMTTLKRRDSNFPAIIICFTNGRYHINFDTEENMMKAYEKIKKELI